MGGESVMRVYVHEGHGHWIGSCVVVIAESPLQAVEMIRKELDDGGLPNEAVTIQRLREYTPDRPKVVHFDNGDY
jgi:hypothetical protein